MSIPPIPLPLDGFVRIAQIIGDKRRGIPGVFPVSRSAWYSGCSRGVYPAPIRAPGTRASLWRVADIRALLAKLGDGQ